MVTSVSSREESVLERFNPVRFYHRNPDKALAVAMGLIVVAGFVARLFELAERPLHHDESLDAWYSWRFLEGTYEGYDPVYHGPLRFYITAFFFEIIGESTATARILTVLSGTAMIGLPWFLRAQLGRGVALVSSAVLAFSPIALYVTRLGREDSLIALITLGMMVVIVRFWDRPRVSLALLFGFLLAAGFAVKETTFITLFIFGSFFLALLVEQAARSSNRSIFSGRKNPSQSSAEKEQHPEGNSEHSWILFVGLVPMAIAFAVGTRYEVFLTLGFYGIFLLAALLFWASPRKIWNLPLVQAVRQVPFWGWLLALSVFLFFFALWFTVFFGQPDGFFKGFTEGITYWRDEQATNRGGEPWYYYLYVVPLYEYLVSGLAIIGAVHVLRNPTFVGKFVLWTAVASWLSYSWASERFPWLALHLVVPMSILAGYGVRVLWRARHQPWTRPAGVILVALMATTAYHSFITNYVNQRDPRELMTQVHTTYDYVDTFDRIEAVNAYAKEIGQQPLTVALDTAYAVPALWYYRDYVSTAEYQADFLDTFRINNWVSSTNSALAAQADFVLFQTSAAFDEALSGHFITRDLGLRDWWAPHFESYHDGWFSGWANWLVDREVWNPGTLNSTDFNLAISPRVLDLESQMVILGRLPAP